MEIHILSHFQKNKVPQPTCPALIVAGGNSRMAWANKGKSRVPLDTTGGKESQISTRLRIKDTGALFAISSKERTGGSGCGLHGYLRREKQAL